MEPFRAETLLKAAGNFMTCRILLTAAEMDLFTILAEAPLTASETAKKSGAEPRALTILLDALAALEFLTKENDAYHCRPPLAPLLTAGSPNAAVLLTGGCLTTGLSLIGQSLKSWPIPSERNCCVETKSSGQVNVRVVVSGPSAMGAVHWMAGLRADR